MLGLRRFDVSLAVFSAFFFLLLIGAGTIDRTEWPLIGDEAVYRMQAESLAFDFDLRYSAEDHRRFVEHHGFAPEGLILQSGDAGSSITFGKPFFYAVYLSPWVRFAPQRGPFVANVLLLWFAAWTTTRVLRKRLKSYAPLWVLLCVFGSTLFAQVFWVHADLFLACLTALAFAAAIDGEKARRWFVVGALFAAVGWSRPMYLALLLPAFLAASARERRDAGLRIGAAAIAVVLLAALVHQALADAWTGYGGTRRGFYSYTGFPDVDFPAQEWQENLKEWGNHAWVDPTEVVRHKKIDAALWAWNSVYLLCGRHVGLVPYFLPLFIALLARPGPRRLFGVLLATGLIVGAFFWLRPFNFWGGGAALANRYFLPLYPLFWFLPREIGPRRLLGGLLAASLFLHPLWTSPRAFPLAGPDGYRYASSAAASVLPFETSQSHLKPGGEDTHHRSLWVKFLDRNVWQARESEALRVRGEADIARFLVAGPRSLPEIVVEAALPEGMSLEIDGEALQPRGAWSRWKYRPQRVARHPMWWTWDPVEIYLIELRPRGKGPIPLRLRKP